MGTVLMTMTKSKKWSKGEVDKGKDMCEDELVSKLPFECPVTNLRCVTEMFVTVWAVSGF